MRFALVSNNFAPVTEYNTDFSSPSHFNSKCDCTGFGYYRTSKTEAIGLTVSVPLVAAVISPRVTSARAAPVTKFSLVSTDPECSTHSEALLSGLENAASAGSVLPFNSESS